MQTILSKQLLELAKHKEGKDLEKIIERILDSDIYIMADYIDLPSIQNLKKAGSKYYNTLYLFAFEDYTKYKEKKANCIELNAKLLNKLKGITVLEIAKNKKLIDFTFLKHALDIKTNYELENIIFDVVSKDYLEAKIDAKNELVKVNGVRTRKNYDNKKNEEALGKIIDNINGALLYIETQEKKFEENGKIVEKDLNIPL